jgi:hypothetical protein
MMAVQAQVSPVITERRNSMIAKTCAYFATGVPPPRLSACGLSQTVAMIRTAKKQEQRVETLVERVGAGTDVLAGDAIGAGGLLTAGSCGSRP